MTAGSNEKRSQERADPPPPLKEDMFIPHPLPPPSHSDTKHRWATCQLGCPNEKDELQGYSFLMTRPDGNCERDSNDEFQVYDTYKILSQVTL